MPWIDLILVLFAGALWYLGLSWQPLIIALLPWILRIVTGKPPFRRTPFDIPLLLFVVSAGVGVWASYDPLGAWSKFWLLLGAVFLFYALSGQPRENQWLITAMIGFFGVFVAAYFLLTHDWQSYPAKLTQLNEVLIHWSQIRPDFGLTPLPPNVAASLLAISLPFLVAWFVHIWPQAKRPMLGMTFIAMIIVVTVLLIATSRGAMLAICFALGLYSLIRFGRFIERQTNLHRYIVIALLLLASSAILVSAVFLLNGWQHLLLDNIPSPSSSTSRIMLGKQTTDLIEDFPIFGAGLGSFPGLYSQYILIIPYYFLPNGHNLFLDAALEQGPLGVVSMTVIFVGTFVLLSNPPNNEKFENIIVDDSAKLRWAIAAGLIIMLTHGLVEDTIYGSPAILGLFVLSGQAVATSLPVSGNSSHTIRQASILTTGAILFLLIFFTVTVLLKHKQSLSAAIKTNLGTVSMAKVELAGFPSGAWNKAENLPALQPAENLFLEVVYGEESRTIHYRLGLIAMLRQDYDGAIDHLRAADSLGSPHRGIRKNLAYSYIWAGNIGESRALLGEIPEAKNEMEAYSWWWMTKGRDDLADRAMMVTELLTDSTQS